MLPGSVNYGALDPYDYGIGPACADQTNRDIGGGIMDTMRISPQFDQFVQLEEAAPNQIASEYDKFKPRKVYDEVITRSIEKYHEYSTNEKYTRFIKKYKPSMDVVLGEIWILRQEDNQGHIANFLKDKRGMKLLQAPMESSAVEGAPRYRKVQIAATLREYAKPENAAEFNRIFGSREAFIEFVDENGKPGAALNEYRDSRKSHWRIKEIWGRAWRASIVDGGNKLHCI